MCGIAFAAACMAEGFITVTVHMQFAGQTPVRQILKVVSISLQNWLAASWWLPARHAKHIGSHEAMHP